MDLYEPDEIPPAAKLAAGPNRYTPTLIAATSPVLGDDGEINGLWYRDGLWVDGVVRVRLFGDNMAVGSGALSISLPPDLPVDGDLVDIAASTLGHCIGEGFHRNATSASTAQLRVIPNTATTVCLIRSGVNALLAASDLNATQSRLIVTFGYPVDPAFLPF